MQRRSGSYTSFNGGEYSPLLDGRTDWEFQRNGCRTLINGIPTTQGPIVKRLGTRYVTAQRNGTTTQGRLIAFIFNVTDMLVLELTEGVIRFFDALSFSPILSGGVPYEVVSPYLEADLPFIKCRQRGDVMYLTCPGYRQRKLSRFANDNWTLAAVNFTSGPVVDGDDDEATTMQYAGSGGVGGSATITASDANFGTNGIGFEDGHIGSLWAFEEASASLSPYQEWEPGLAVVANNYLRYQGRLYLVKTTGTTGDFTPVHEGGTVSDGTVDLEFTNFGIGYATMTSRNSATEAVFTVQRALPPTMQTGSPQFAATTYWNEAEWSDVRGYPKALEFHEERLVFGGVQKNPLFVDASRSNRRFEAFDPAQAQDDGALRFELTGQYDAVQWLQSDGNFLLMGTGGGLAFLGSGYNQEALTPTNVRAKRNQNIGSSYIEPVNVYNSVQYVSRNRKRLLQAQYDDVTLNYSVFDLCVNNPEISGAGLRELAKMQEPYMMVCATRDDGQMPVVVQEDKQKVIAWWRFITGARDDGSFDKVESVVAFPGEDGDILWMIVRRNIGGVDVRYIEYMEPLKQNERQFWYVDCGIEYDGVPTTTITGLSHLEGRDVTVLADGRRLQSRAVSGGAITLQSEARKVRVGLPYAMDVEPMLINDGSADGSSQGKDKRIHKMVLKLYRTQGLKAGRSKEHLRNVPFQETGNLAVNGEALLFGDEKSARKEFAWDGDHQEGEIYLRHDYPLPCTIVSINPRYSTA